jgi:hypothetical protein
MKRPKPKVPSLLSKEWQERVKKARQKMRRVLRRQKSKSGLAHQDEKARPMEAPMRDGQ